MIFVRKEDQVCQVLKHAHDRDDRVYSLKKFNERNNHHAKYKEENEERKNFGILTFVTSST